MGRLHIMIGVSGSGKSTKVNQLITCADWLQNPDHRSLVASADHFFTAKGEYEFNPSELKWAHQRCQGMAAFGMKAGYSDVIVDNTNVVQEHIKPYLEMANHFNYDVVYHRVHGELSDKQIEKFAKRNRHGVPKEVIERQYKNFKEDWL